MKNSKTWFPYNRSVPAVPAVVSRAEYDHGTCALSGTAGRVRSCLRYRRYRTVTEKQSHESLMKRSSPLSALEMAAGSKKQASFAKVVLLVIEDSIEEEIKSNVNTKFWIIVVKYFDNVNKMDNSTSCLLN